MKKTDLLLMAVIGLFAMTTFNACSKDDDSEGATSPIIGDFTAEVTGDAVPDGAIIKVIVGYSTDGNNYASVVVGSGTCTAAKLTLRLNESVESQYLYTISDEIAAGVTVSNANVKGTERVNVGAYNGDNRIGSFYYEAAPWKSSLMYVDGDVSITGSYVDGVRTTTYDIHAKKGWNIAYETDTETKETRTTKAPSGMKWVYEDYVQ
jgi:hypothetical protein